MDYQNHPINLIWTAGGKTAFYRKLMRIRRFELRTILQYSAGKMADW